MVAHFINLRLYAPELFVQGLDIEFGDFPDRLLDEFQDVVHGDFPEHLVLVLFHPGKGFVKLFLPAE